MKNLRLRLIVIAILWLFDVPFSYYIVHKSFSTENALALFGAFANIVVAWAIFSLAAVMGQGATRTFGFASMLEAIFIRTGLRLEVIIRGVRAASRWLAQPPSFLGASYFHLSLARCRTRLCFTRHSRHAPYPRLLE